MLRELSQTLPNRQCRHTGEGRYPVLSSAGFRVKPGMTGGGIIQRSACAAGNIVIPAKAGIQNSMSK